MEDLSFTQGILKAVLSLLVIGLDTVLAVVAIGTLLSLFGII